MRRTLLGGVLGQEDCGGESDGQRNHRGDCRYEQGAAHQRQDTVGAGLEYRSPAGAGEELPGRDLEEEADCLRDQREDDADGGEDGYERTAEEQPANYPAPLRIRRLCVACAAWSRRTARWFPSVVGAAALCFPYMYYATCPCLSPSERIVNNPLMKARPIETRLMGL